MRFNRHSKFTVVAAASCILLVSSDGLADDSNSLTSTIFSVVGKISDSFGAGQAAGFLLQVFNLIQNDQAQMQQEILALGQQLDKEVGALSWQINAQACYDRLGEMQGDVSAANEALQAGHPPSWNDSELVDSNGYVLAAEQDIAFQRVFAPELTAGDWNYVFHQPPLDNGLVYDWRLGVPALAQLLPLRLDLLAVVDPNFAVDGTDAVKSELRTHVQALQRQRKTMADGIVCTNDHATPAPTPHVPNQVQVQWGCADIYTGKSQIKGKLYPDGHGQPGPDSQVVAAHAYVLSTMPMPALDRLTDKFVDLAGGPTDLIIANGSGSYWYQPSAAGSAWSVPYARTDLPSEETQYTTGDFNDDQHTDVIVTNASGSYWYFSNGDGTWSGPYQRSDLPLGSVVYTPGDFNGDGKTDLVVTDASGSYWYLSNGDGTWQQASARTDLPLGTVQYTPGDFDGDGRTDLVITNASGSYFYFSKGSVTANEGVSDPMWYNPYSRTDLKLGSVQFKTGDFNGDDRTDLLISNLSGSYWYFSNGDGTFSQPYSRTDLTTSNTVFTTGDFDGDHKTDLVITNGYGSYWYFSNGDGTWRQPYQRTDLAGGFQALAFTPGDFDHDGKTDLVISDQAGSYWYLSNGDGTWRTPYSRTDLPVFKTVFVPGRFFGK